MDKPIKRIDTDLPQRRSSRRAPRPLGVVAEALHDLLLETPEVSKFLAEYATRRVRRMRWPHEEMVQQKCLTGLARELAKVGGDPDNTEARAAITMLAKLLQENGFIDAVPVVAFPGNDPASHRTIADLRNHPDPTGTQTFDRVQRDIVVALTAILPDVPTLARAAATGICLSFAAPDVIPALAKAGWCDIDWEAGRLALPKPLIRHGEIIAQSARFVMLSPLLQLALAALQVHVGGRSIFSPSGNDREAGVLIGEAIAHYGLTKGHVQTGASRRARQFLPGWIVDSAIADTEAYTPLLNDEALDLIISARFSADIPADNRDLDAPTPQLRTSQQLPPLIRATLHEVNAILPGKRKRVTIKARDDAARLIRRHVATLLASELPSEPLPILPSLRKAIVGLFDRIEKGDDNRSPQRAAIVANTACVLLFLAYRLGRPSGSDWLERNQEEPGAAGEARKQPLVAIGTIWTRNGDLTAVLQLIGDVPLTQWSASEWLTIEDSTGALSTLKSRLDGVRQLGDYVRTQLGLRIQLGWPTAPGEDINTSIVLPSAGQLVAAFKALARIPEYGSDALLLATAMLGYGLREQEAAYLLLREIDGLSCHVDASSAKDGENRRAPLGWLPRIAIEALAERQREVAEELKTATTEPWLLKGAAHRDHIVALVRKTLADRGMHPHLLRHCHITWRQLAQVAFHAEPGGEWPIWIRAAAQEPDSLRGGAQGAGHLTSRMTRSVYTHLHLWLTARAWRQQDTPFLSILVRRNIGETALLIPPSHWHRALVTIQSPTRARLAAGRITLAEVVAAMQTLM